MVNNRDELHDLLESILDNNGCVYYQPPENYKIKYPCIMYTKDENRCFTADNMNYIIADGYTLTYISRKPDDIIPRKILTSLKKCYASNYFTVDNLYHYNFKVFI